MMTFRDYPELGECIYSGVLENGLAVYVMPKKDYVKTFAAFATRYGGSDCRFKLGDEFVETPAGIAHFLEHKMFDMPDGKDAMTELSALGASPNAFTGPDTTCYIFSCTDRLDESLRVLLDFVMTPYFTDASVAKEQGIIGQEIRMCEDNPSHAVFENLLRAMYSEHPVRISVPGTVESIAEITPRTLYDCHKVFYNPSNMVLAVAGRVDPEAVFEAARETVTAEAGDIPVRDADFSEGPLAASGRISKEMDVSIPTYLIGFKLDPDPAGGEALFRQNLLAELAMDYLAGPSSGLYARLYEQGLINDSFGCGVGDEAGALYAYISAEGENCDAVAAEILKEADALGASGGDADYFERLKRSGIGGTLRALNSPEACCMLMINSHFFGYDAMTELNVINSFSEEEVLAFMKENIISEKMTLSVIEPIKKVKT
ncbi:MAG: insulinase family protein [Oscillospiraceae bacterium]|nr:insulinase family protein [Oscillospiraceae bacterium]